MTRNRSLLAADVGLVSLVLLVALLLATAGCVPLRPMPIVDYCSLPWARCPGCDVVGCDGAQEQWWCCDPDGGCWPVDYALDCAGVSGGWIAYCEHGRSTEQSTPDGEGWEYLE